MVITINIFVCGICGWVNVLILMMSYILKSGYTLLEVLIAMFVLLIGLLAVASLTSVGVQNVVDARKISEAAACGRQAINEISIQDWLNPERLTADIDPYLFIIDPQGIMHGIADNVDGIPRISLIDVTPIEYTSYDDIIFDYEQDRPEFYDRQKYYTWFATVCNGTLTAAVCYKRTFAEQIFDIQIDFPILGYGSIHIPANIDIKDGQFLLIIYDNDIGRQSQWYKVHGDVHDGMIDIAGPDLHNAINTKAVLFDDVVGVCVKYLSCD